MQISVSEARERLPELVLRAAFGDEDFTILRRGKPAARLVPLADKSTAKGNGDRAKQKRNVNK